MSGQQSNKIEVLWSPNNDGDLATYGSELKLYTVRELEVSIVTYAEYEGPE